MKNTVIISGATSGIGFAICKKLLDSGYPVIAIGRSEDNCRTANETLLRQQPDAKLNFIAADLMQQREVLRAAKEIKEIIKASGSDIHALINNAGCVRSRYMTTEEGYEQQFALNHLAGFLLTQELLPLIRRSNAMVINTSSVSHKMMRVNWNDLMYQRRYRPLSAYKQSKLCNLLFAHRLRELGIRACGVHPGLVKTDIGEKNTSGVVNFVWNLRKKRGIDPEESAKIFLSLCENGFCGLYYGLRGDVNGTLKIEEGKFEIDARELKYSGQVNHENARRLYDISLKLCGMPVAEESAGNSPDRSTRSRTKGEKDECSYNGSKRWAWQSDGYRLRKAGI